MRIKNIFTVAAVALAGALSSCEQDPVLYDGPDYVKFADTLQYVAIQNNEDYHEVIVATTRAVDYDRTFGVEIVEKESNAIEGYHYTVESNSVTIPAGKMAAPFRFRGNFDNIIDTDSMGITIRLVNKEMLYKDSEHAHVILRKVAPFNVNTFTGYVRIKASSFFNDFMPNTSELIAKSHAVEGTDNQVVIENFLFKGYDLTLTFSTRDPLEPAVSLKDGEVIGTTIQLAGGMVGDNMVRVVGSNAYTPFFNSCQHYAILYPTFYIDGVGSLGTYIFALEWISDAEAEAGY